MKTREEFINFLLKVGHEEVHLYNDGEDAFIKIMPGGDAVVKTGGGNEFKTDKESKIVFDAIIGEHEITKDQFDNTAL